MKYSSKEVCDCVEVHVEEVNKVQMPDDIHMNELTQLFKAFGDASRLRIITALSQALLCVCDLCELLGLEQSAVSHKLRYLKRLHIVKSQRVGKSIFYSLDDEHVNLILNMGLEHVYHDVEK